MRTRSKTMSGWGPQPSRVEFGVRQRCRPTSWWKVWWKCKRYCMRWELMLLRSWVNFVSSLHQSAFHPQALKSNDEEFIKYWIFQTITSSFTHLRVDTAPKSSLPRSRRHSLSLFHPYLISLPPPDPLPPTEASKPFLHPGKQTNPGCLRGLFLHPSKYWKFMSIFRGVVHRTLSRGLWPFLW